MAATSKAVSYGSPTATAAATAARPATATAAAARPATATVARAQPKVQEPAPAQGVSQTVSTTFATFDKDNSGTLDKTELKAALKHLGMDYTTAEAIAILERYDSATTNKDLDINEFNAMVLELQAEQQRAKEEARLGVRPSATAATAAAAAAAATGKVTDAVKPQEISQQMKSQEVLNALTNFKVALSELFEQYARLQGKSIRLDPETCVQMLKDFNLVPGSLGETNVRAAIKQLRAANPPPTDAASREPPATYEGVTRKEFDELLLRLSRLYAEPKPALKTALPHKKLYELLKSFDVGDIAKMRARFTKSSSDNKPKSSAASAAGGGAGKGAVAAPTALGAAPLEARKREAAALKLQAVQKGRMVRENSPQAIAKAHRRPKGIEVTVHTVRLSASTLAADPSVRTISVGTRLAELKDTAEMSEASHAVRMAEGADGGGPLPIAVEWSATYRLGPKSAALRAVRQGIFRPPPNAALAALEAVEGVVSSGVRDAFERYDRDRSGLLDEREIREAFKQLDLDASADEIKAVMSKYSDAADGKIDIGQFNRMVIDLHRRAQEAADRSVVALEPSLPLRVMLHAGRGGGSLAPPAELAYAEIDLARGHDLRKEEFPLLSSADGGPMGTITLTVRASAAVKPFIAVRKAFTSIDANGDGALTQAELLPGLRKLGVVASEFDVKGFHTANSNNDGKLSLAEFEKLYR